MTNWTLLVLAAAAAAAAAAEKLGFFAAPVPPIVFGVAAVVFALLLILRELPLNARRASVFFLALVGLVGLTGGLAYFHFVIKPPLIKGAIGAMFAAKATTVDVEPARLESWTPELTAIGTLRAYQGVTIAPQVAGVVTAIHFESGNEVAEGAPLINLDDSVEQADLANMLAQLKNAQAALERAKTLLASGNTPQSTADAAIAAHDSGAASVERTRALIAQKAIKAPFAGRVGLRNVDLGQYVGVGMPLVTLQRLDPIYADFPLPEQALTTLAVGQQVVMRVDALGGREFHGVLKAIDARVAAESRNVTARAEFANPDHVLLPGMFAMVTVASGAPVEVLTVPRTAIVYSLYGDNVFVASPAPAAPAATSAAIATAGGAAAAPAPATPGAGLIAERRFVRVGEARGERLEVLEGVKAGERVVVAGQIKLQNNSPILLGDTPALPPPAETPKP